MACIGQREVTETAGLAFTETKTTCFMVTLYNTRKDDIYRIDYIQFIHFRDVRSHY